jgi:hypothetical protein
MAISSASLAPFPLILVKTRVNRRKIEALKSAGVRVVDRTDTRTYEIRANHEAQRGHKHYVRGGERENATGEKVGDSGCERIGFNRPENGTADPTKVMTLAKVIEDLEAMGYRFRDCHVLVRPEEPNGMGFLVIAMVMNPDEVMSVTEQAAAMINDYTTRCYRSVFVFENPDGSCTINANHGVVGDDLKAATDRRELRFRVEDGRTHWESAKQ